MMDHQGLHGHNQASIPGRVAYFQPRRTADPFLEKPSVVVFGAIEFPSAGICAPMKHLEYKSPGTFQDFWKLEGKSIDFWFVIRLPFHHKQVPTIVLGHAAAWGDAMHAGLVQRQPPPSSSNGLSAHEFPHSHMPYRHNSSLALATSSSFALKTGISRIYKEWELTLICSLFLNLILAFSSLLEHGIEAGSSF